MSLHAGDPGRWGLAVVSHLFSTKLSDAEHKLIPNLSKVGLWAVKILFEKIELSQTACELFFVGSV